MNLRLPLVVVAVLCLGLPGRLPARELVRQPAVPLDVRVPATPSWIPARDGRHALYELHLANYRDLPLEILRLDVLDAGDGGLLASLEGEALLSSLSRPGRTQGPGGRNVIGGGETAVAYVELIRHEGEALPAAVRHAWYVRRAAGEGEEPAEKTWLMESDAVPVAPAPRFVLGPPLRGAGWLAANGLGNRANHRRTLLAIDGKARISQRYAIDFIRIGPDGLVATADPPANGDFFAYGAELLAVADGVVAAVHDGMPENVPFSEHMAVPITLETIAGNHVILDIGGAYVMYAHLQPGTVTVEPGQAVRRGDVLGRLGNSGNSDAPHLHLQVTDRPAPLAAEGLPFTFEGFGWQGDIPELDAWLASRAPWRPAAAEPEARRDELPLGGDVVAFPD